MSQKIANKGDGNQIAQFGGDLNGTFNQINGTRTLASLTPPELAEEYLLASSIVSRERKSRLKRSAIAAMVCLLCCGITVAMYWLFGQPSWPGLVLWTGCFEGCWWLLVVLRPLVRVLVG